MSTRIALTFPALPDNPVRLGQTRALAQPSALRARAGVIVVASVLMWPSTALAGAEDVPVVLPIVEVRNGHQTVCGMEIRLGWVTLQDAAALRLITITEDKQGHDLTAALEKSITADLSTVIIRFHGGAGNLGAGDAVTITIPRAACSETWRKGDPLVFHLATDLPAEQKP